MKKFLVFVFLILFVTIQCNDDGGYKQSLENQWKIGLMMSAIEEFKKCKSLHTNYEITEINVGIIRMNIEGECPETKYYKKCLQGQVYRKSENDCKGIGNESNLYGAQLLSMCVNPQSCFSYYPEGVISCEDEAGIAGYFPLQIATFLVKANDTLKNKEIWNGESLKLIKLPATEIREVDNVTEKHYVLCYAKPINN
jgi:hypothetical protein